MATQTFGTGSSRPTPRVARQCIRPTECMHLTSAHQRTKCICSRHSGQFSAQVTTSAGTHYLKNGLLFTLERRTATPVHTQVLKGLMATDRTSLKLTDDRKRLFDQASEIVARDDADDPPRSDVIDAALTHLIESQQNLENVRDQYPPQHIKRCCNTSVLGLRYRTSIESKWR